MSEQQKEQQLLETVDRIIAEGPYQPAWSSLMQTKTPDWFKQIWHLHPLGRLQCSRQLQRMVPKKHVHRGNARIRTPYKNLRQPERLWI